MDENKPVELQRVIVTDVQISFGNLVELIVKFVFACIPAALIIVLIVIAIGFLFKGVRFG